MQIARKSKGGMGGYQKRTTTIVVVRFFGIHQLINQISELNFFYPHLTTNGTTVAITPVVITTRMNKL